MMKAGASTTACGGSVATPGRRCTSCSSPTTPASTGPRSAAAARHELRGSRPSGPATATPAHFDIYYSGGLTCTGPRARAACVGLRCTGLPAVGSPNVTIGHADPSTVAFTPDGTHCARFLVSDGGVGRSTDCGATFPMVAGLRYRATATSTACRSTRCPARSTRAHSHYVFGTQDNSIYGSCDSGATWPNVVVLRGLQLPDEAHRTGAGPGDSPSSPAVPCANRRANTDLTGAGAGRTRPARCSAPTPVRRICCRRRRTPTCNGLRRGGTTT